MFKKCQGSRQKTLLVRLSTVTPGSVLSHQVRYKKYLRSSPAISCLRRAVVLVRAAVNPSVLYLLFFTLLVLWAESGQLTSQAT